MNDLVSMLQGETLEETVVRVVVFLAIGEFIGAIFSLIGKMKG